ncbi:hypothetical protein QJS66_08845 [Kocuria rhizophila]|nr:hypothetical protein QJS66_08845 [Kocuria rhizophila]
MKLPSCARARSAYATAGRARLLRRAGPDRARPDAGRRDPHASPRCRVIELLVVAAVSPPPGALLPGAVWAAAARTPSAGGSLRLAGQVWAASHGLRCPSRPSRACRSRAAPSRAVGLTLIPSRPLGGCRTTDRPACWRGQFLLLVRRGHGRLRGVRRTVGSPATEEASVDLVAAAFCPRSRGGARNRRAAERLRSLAAVLGSRRRVLAAAHEPALRRAGSYVWATRGLPGRLWPPWQGARCRRGGPRLELGRRHRRLPGPRHGSRGGHRPDPALQLGTCPNMVVWRLPGPRARTRWRTTTSPSTVLGPLPQAVLAAVPTGDPCGLARAPAIPVVAGLLAAGGSAGGRTTWTTGWPSARPALITFLALHRAGPSCSLPAVGAGLLGARMASDGSLALRPAHGRRPARRVRLPRLGASSPRAPPWATCSVAGTRGLPLPGAGHRTTTPPRPPTMHGAGTPTMHPALTGADGASEEPLGAPADRSTTLAPAGGTRCSRPRRTTRPRARPAGRTRTSPRDALPPAPRSLVDATPGSP